MFVGHIIKIKNKLYFSSNEQCENEMKIFLLIITKRTIKNTLEKSTLKITKHSKNVKICIYRKTSHVHELRDLILLKW